ncbi:hypothetical protein [Streptomyces sp. NPDC048650]|uniref:hypothetical protein n=1 Tax=unclassified Streptomyces TaxID=2593676 RepID=UPI00371C91C1
MTYQQQSYACPACGSTAEFTPGKNVLSCPHCRFEQPIAPVNRQIQEHAWEELATLPPKPRATGGQTLTCSGCGAVNETDMLSGRCQFCASPMVASAATDRIVPEGLVPFRLERRAVHDHLRTWAKSRWFAPNSLKKVSSAESLHGTYVPHWTYDAWTASAYTGERGRVVKNGDSQSVRWKQTSGTVQRFFDDVLAPGTSHVRLDRLKDLEPWPLHQAVPFQEEYLAGFRTLRYDVEPEAGWQYVTHRMAEAIKEDCRKDIGGDRQRVHSVNTNYASVTYKLMLLPVWFASYVYKGKQWQVVVNADTGEVTGDRPYSPWKIAFAMIVATVVAGGMLFMSNNR